MDGAETVSVQMLENLGQISAQEWDSCACPEATSGRPNDPFTTHRFLRALETSGSVGTGTGWTPRHLVARMRDEIIGVMPLYAKGHSQGEYIFDHSWAHAFERAGGRYYPKLLSAVPFTPATGRRFLVRPGSTEETAAAALVQGAVEIAAQNDVASFNVNFCTSAEVEAGTSMGLLHRTGQQFHWQSDGFADFEGFLESLASRKRKQVRKERRTAQIAGDIVALTGEDLRPEHWEAFWNFYQDTGDRKWGSPYLTRRFFNIVQETMRDDVLLVLCFRDDQPIAGALNFIGRETLYGRYWGCVEHHDCLHFELCYYQAIERALELGLSRVEAGAQGDHKLARGYLPIETHSLHWIADAGFREAIGNYLGEERDAIDFEIGMLSRHSPFRKDPSDD